MNRRKFITAGTTTAVGLGSMGLTQAHPFRTSDSTAAQEYYDFRVYQMKWGGGNTALVNEYLEGAYIPGVKKAGAKHVGVFFEMAQPEPPKVYVLTAYPSMETFLSASQSLHMSESYLADSQSFREIAPAKVAYDRITSSLLQAFSGLPQLRVPAKKDRLFELRIYESYNEDAGWRKVAMFNNGEFDIFDAVGLRPVFFGKNLVGTQLPALTYMLVYEDMEAREEQWKAFLAHPDWNKMKNDPQYANTVSSITRVFLEPAEYSDI